MAGDTVRVADLREWIAGRIRAAVVGADPRQQILADVQGPVSPAFLKSLDSPLHAAAVLIALIERPEGLTILLTERASHLRAHPGQISLPGGRVAPSDAGPVAAALREAHEEVGMAPADVEVVGTLDVQLTVTGFAVTPVVGFVADRFRAMPDPAEVAGVFELPFASLMRPGAMQVYTRERLGTRFLVPEIHYGRYRVWGATATILSRFLEVISID